MDLSKAGGVGRDNKGVSSASSSSNNRASLIFQHLHATVPAASAAVPRMHVRHSVTEGGGGARGQQQGMTDTWGRRLLWLDMASAPATATTPRGWAWERSLTSYTNRTSATSVADETSRLLGGAGQAPASEPVLAGSKWRWLSEFEYMDVAKAVVGYSLAALFPFIPYLRDWLGDPEYMSPHLVTNAAIWFHAAKTRSALVECLLVGVLWVCVTSGMTYVAVYVAQLLHFYFAPAASLGADAVVVPLAWQSKAVSLGVFIFGYSWLLGFFKANATRDSVNTATTISNIALYLVMLREAPVVNYKDVGDVGESFGKKTEHVLVALLTGMAVSFAVGWFLCPVTAASELRGQLQRTFASFRRILPQLLQPIVSPQALGHHKGVKLHGAKPEGLKDELRAHRKSLGQLRTKARAIALEPTEWGAWARRESIDALINCLDGLGLHLSALSCGLELRTSDPGTEAPANDLVYADVVGRIRAPVMRLGDACDRALMGVGELADRVLGGQACVLEDVEELRNDLQDAIGAFQRDYGVAVEGLAAHEQADPEEVAQAGADLSASVEEQLFIVHFFVFSLREFADELVDMLLPAAVDLCRPPLTPMQTLVRGLREPRRIYRRAQSFGRWIVGKLRILCDTGATAELERRYEMAQFADPRSLHSQRPTTTVQRLSRSIWHVLMWTRRLNVKFATKYALLVTLLSLPCYWDIDTYWGFRERRLEWMVISAAVIMVPTVGGSALTSTYRVLGTCSGGFIAFVAYEAGCGIPWFTYLLLVAFSIPCFWFILRSSYPKIGQFALITFGVVLVNKWVAREDQGEGAGVLAARRTLAVALGALAGMAVTLYVWPYEARVRVRQALSWWVLTAAVLYERLWNTLWSSDSGKTSEWCAVATVREYLNSELQLQSALVEIRALVGHTLNEPRLKGPFPTDKYQRIINACQRMLDAMVAARWVMLPMPMALVIEHAPLPGRPSSESESESESDDSQSSVSPACTDQMSNTTNSSRESRLSLLDLPIALASTVLMEREQLGMDNRLAMFTSSSTPLPSPASYRSCSGSGDEDEDIAAIRQAVEKELLRQTASEREHRDALVSLTMYVFASALVLKTPLPAVLPPIYAAQRRVAEAMDDLLGLDRIALDAASNNNSNSSALVQRAVARTRYVFYYTQVMIGWELVQELSIIGGLLRELYGSYGNGIYSNSQLFQ
ncbi:hypothetical protein FB645_003441 [Coemansia sp. IMI 203386]|nr:hypothetical protein FB645_003441 [Coemansia sp. IMI 203386]